jgi:NMD protein affecting ribosome stability and mRNA decay
LPEGRLFVKILAVQDVDAARGSSCTVTKYVWAVLKVRALGRELNRAVEEIERHRTVLVSSRQADVHWAEAQALLKQLEAEADGADAHSGS